MKSNGYRSMLLLALLNVASFATGNPVDSYKARFQIPANDMILKWEADLNGDGRHEVFLSLKSDFITDKQNHDVPGWAVYIAAAPPSTDHVKSEGTEFEPNKISVGTLPMIDPEICYVGQITQLGKRGVVTMRIDNPRDGESVATIYAFCIEGNHLKYTQLTQFTPGQSNTIFDQYLKDGVRTEPQLQEVTP